MAGAVQAASVHVWVQQAAHVGAHRRERVDGAVRAVHEHPLDRAGAEAAGAVGQVGEGRHLLPGARSGDELALGLVGLGVTQAEVDGDAGGGRGGDATADQEAAAAGLRRLS